MKNVILIGDSIRMGYDKYVKNYLADSCEVYYPKDNCRFTQYVLRNTHAWVEESGFGEDTDLVHWNVGLWDVAQVLGISISSAYELMHEKDFPSMRIGNRLIVPKEKFKIWIDEKIGK